jgi:hypothetical protein
MILKSKFRKKFVAVLYIAMAISYFMAGPSQAGGGHPSVLSFSMPSANTISGQPAQRHYSRDASGPRIRSDKSSDNDIFVDSPIYGSRFSRFKKETTGKPPSL